MVGGAEGHDPLVAYLSLDGPRLGKTKMVGVTWRTPTREAGLPGYGPGPGPSRSPRGRSHGLRRTP